MHDYIILLLLVLKSHPYKIMLSRFVSACHETELSIEPDSIHDDEKLSIGVIGSGPAGMAFAHTAATIGHHVTLFDKSDEIGGMINLFRHY